MLPTNFPPPIPLPLHLSPQGGNGNGDFCVNLLVTFIFNVLYRSLRLVTAPAPRAWYEKGDENEGENIEVKRRDNRRAGQRREGKQETYLGRHRSVRRAMEGWRGSGFRLGGGHKAYDAEVAAIAYGLAHLHGRAEQGHTYTISTDSVAAMMRVM